MPDNFIQQPFNTQSYNRYGYVLNNPLLYIDPSGERAENEKDEDKYTVLEEVVVVARVKKSNRPSPIDVWSVFREIGEGRAIVFSPGGGGGDWFRNISDSKTYPGISIYETDYMAKGTGVTLPGIGIFIHSSVTGNNRVRMLQHEYGHYLDYKFSPDINFPGQIPLVNFYMMIGIPSILNLTPGINMIPGLDVRHHDFYTEQRADRWAEIWFGKNYLK